MPFPKVALGLVCGCLCATLATALAPGQYYISAVKTGLCDDSSGVSYLAFKNKTCGIEAGPVIRSGETSMSWKQWTLSIITGSAATDGSFKAKISNYYKNNKTLCLGSIAVGRSDKCTGTSAEKVSLRTKGSAWRLVPVGSSGAYQIIAESRDSNCLRYLGAACDAPTVRIFASDDGSGAQQWTLKPIKVTPSPSPSSSPPPSPAPVASPPPPAPVKLPAKPGGINTVYVDEKMWFVTWIDTPTISKNGGTQEETYTLKCTYAGQKCDGPAVGTVVTGIPRGVQQGSVPNLPAGSSLNCFVIAVNGAGSTCSDPVPVTTKLICDTIPGCTAYNDDCQCTKCPARPGCAAYDPWTCNCSKCQDKPGCTAYDLSDCSCTACIDTFAGLPTLVKYGECRTAVPMAFDITDTSSAPYRGGIYMCSDLDYSAGCTQVKTDFPDAGTANAMVYVLGKYYSPNHDASGAIRVCDSFDIIARKLSGCKSVSFPSYVTSVATDGTRLYIVAHNGVHVCTTPDVNNCNINFKAPADFQPTAIALNGNGNAYMVGTQFSGGGSIFVCDWPAFKDCTRKPVSNTFSFGVATDETRVYYSDFVGFNLYTCNLNLEDCQTTTIVAVSGVNYFNNKLLVGPKLVCDVSNPAALPQCSAASGLDGLGPSFQYLQVVLALPGPL